MRNLVVVVSCLGMAGIELPTASNALNCGSPVRDVLRRLIDTGRRRRSRAEVNAEAAALLPTRAPSPASTRRKTGPATGDAIWIRLLEIVRKEHLTYTLYVT